MLDKNRLFALSELELGGNVMDDAQFIVLASRVEDFIDGFPEKEAEIKIYLREKNYEALVQGLSATRNTLLEIYAMRLAGECLRQIDRIKEATAGAEHTRIEEDLLILMKNISMLSIDIQMEKLQEEKEAGAAADASPDQPDQPAPAPPPPPLPPPRPPRTGPANILAVDDSAFFLHSLKTHLKGSPYKLTCVNSGADALGFLGKNHADLFILDIDMPQMNGYELAENIRKAGHTAPIIFLTSNAHRISVIKAGQAGASDFILKPIDRAMLLQRINKNIGGS